MLPDCHYLLPGRLPGLCSASWAEAQGSPTSCFLPGADIISLPLQALPPHFLLLSVGLSAKGSFVLPSASVWPPRHSQGTRVGRRVRLAVYCLWGSWVTVE